MYSPLHSARALRARNFEGYGAAKQRELAASSLRQNSQGGSFRVARASELAQRAAARMVETIFVAAANAADSRIQQF